MFKLRPGPKLDLTIFFATDIHGSTLCFKKVLASPAFYHADVVVLGGDLTGKMIVPIVRTADGWEAQYLSSTVRLDGESGVRDFEKTVSDAGYYPFRTTADQVRSDDPTWQEVVFKEQVIDRLLLWDELAGARHPIYVAPGNDDEVYVDEVLTQSRSFVNAEAKEVELPGGYRLFSTGWANRTPWHTAREMDEPALLARLEEIVAGVDDPDHAICNFHVPPKDSGLDTCFEVNEQLQVVSELGQPKLTAAGSTAVRQILTRLQPVASLHGHIHESRGMSRLGRTLAFNPGSEYSEGILRGVLVSLRDGRVERHQFTSG
jgi:Icc-related predicted phosphoesterase